MARERGRRLKGLSHGMNVFRIAIKFNQYDFARNTGCLNDLKSLTKSKNPLQRPTIGEINCENNHGKPSLTPENAFNKPRMKFRFRFIFSYTQGGVGT
jgi:hypothetical protein